MDYDVINVKFELKNSENQVLYTVDQRILGVSRLKYNASIPSKMAQILADVAISNNITDVEILVRGANIIGREKAISTLQKLLNITIIKDVTPIPHNSCKPPLKRCKK